MKRSSSESFLILLVLLFLCVAVIVAVVEAQARRPQYAQVVASQAFVYPGPTAGDFLIALPQGAYRLDGELVDGCYKLTAPAIGAEHGTATYVGASCEAFK